MVATTAIVGDIADSVASLATWALWMVVAVFLAGVIYLGALVWIERDAPLTGAPPDEEAPVPPAPTPAPPVPADEEPEDEISVEELGQFLDELIAEEAEAMNPVQRERIELLASITHLRISLRIRNEVNAILYRLEF